MSAITDSGTAQASVTERPVVLPPVRQQGARLCRPNTILGISRLRSGFALTPRARPNRISAGFSTWRIYDINVDLVRGSHRAIVESREAIAEADKLLGLWGRPLGWVSSP